MGVDYDNCANCGEIYADCSNYGSCQGCSQSWCENCRLYIKAFVYGDDIRCDLCFTTEPEEPSTSDLLEFALKKLGTRKLALRDELIASEKRFREPKNVYHCTADKAKHDCKEGVCLTIAKDWDLEEDECGVDIQRGLCCAVKDKDEEEYWCEECKKSKRAKL